MEQPQPVPHRSEDIAAAMEAIRTLAKAPPPTPGVVDLVIAQLDFITQRIPDSGLQDASIEVARHVAEVHEPAAEPSVSKRLRLNAALSRLEACLGRVSPVASPPK
jgi:hypothetical protein